MQLLLDGHQGALHAVVARHVVRGRVDGDLGEVAHDLAGERVELADPLDGVAPPLDPRADLLVRREDLQRVAGDAERAARPADLVPLVLDVDQSLHGELERDLGALERAEDLALVLLGRTQAVDARDARHDEDVAPAEQRRRGRVAEALDLVVHRRVLLDVGVGGRDVRLGLVVVVVAHEVLDRVVREDLAELVGELGAERLVGRDDQGGALDRLDHVGDREGLAGPGGAQERHVGVARVDALRQLRDRLRLVTGGLELGRDAERGHGAIVGPAADTDLAARARRADTRPLTEGETMRRSMALVTVAMLAVVHDRRRCCRGAGQAAHLRGALGRSRRHDPVRARQEGRPAAGDALGQLRGDAHVRCRWVGTGVGGWVRVGRTASRSFHRTRSTWMTWAATQALHLHGTIQAVHGSGTFSLAVAQFTQDEHVQICSTGELAWTVDRTVPPVESPTPPTAIQVLHFVTASGARVTMTRLS